MSLDTKEIRPVINLLGNIIKNQEIDLERINDSIDSLEDLKDLLAEDDDETIDKLDEAQDYLHYLLSLEDEPISDEIKEEIRDLIETLQDI
ncbi:MAG: hypothetical protein LBR56_01975 [Sporomusaceae bacterium]|jgi:hypothetical protein|nr:hypothetical protein [Sporomusaceae bacterium]